MIPPPIYAGQQHGYVTSGSSQQAQVPWNRRPQMMTAFQGASPAPIARGVSPSSKGRSPQYHSPAHNAQNVVVPGRTYYWPHNGVRIASSSPSGTSSAPDAGTPGSAGYRQIQPATPLLMSRPLAAPVVQRPDPPRTPSLPHREPVPAAWPPQALPATPGAVHRTLSPVLPYRQVQPSYGVLSPQPVSRSGSPPVVENHSPPIRFRTPLADVPMHANGCQTVQPKQMYRELRVVSPVMGYREPITPEMDHRPLRTPEQITRAVPAQPRPPEPMPSTPHQNLAPLREGTAENDDFEAFDVSTVSNVLPPSPPNTLYDFLRAVQDGNIVPALCSRTVRVDTDRCWDKRRVQNLMRRLLESLQEKFEVDAPFGDNKDPVLADKAFNALLVTRNQVRQKAGLPPIDQYGDKYGFQRFPVERKEELSEAEFTDGLDHLHVWPPELTDKDKEEIFLALRVATSSVVRVLRDGHSVPTTLTRRKLADALCNVPFNVPDFPVPWCALRKEKWDVNKVATEIAEKFRDVSTIDAVKDFYLCGLLSIEEVQVALSTLVPQSVLEEAVQKIIREGARNMKQEEWQQLVVAPRYAPEVTGAEPTEPEPEAQQAQQAQQPHQMHEVEERLRDGGMYRQLGEERRMELVLEDAIVDDAAQHLAQAASSRLVADSPELMPSTTPSASGSRSRELRSQEPVMFDHAGSTSTSVLSPVSPEPAAEPSSSLRRLVNWETSRGHSSMDTSWLGSPHQADQGAGSTHSNSLLGDLDARREERPRFGSAANGVDVDDPLPWISMEMHNECRGPYLLKAFVRCCELYCEDPVRRWDRPNASLPQRFVL